MLWFGYKFALVLEATQTLTVALGAAAPAHAAVIVVEELVPRAAVIVLRGRPQVGVAALIVEIARVAPVTGGEHRDAILVGTGTVAESVPAASRFKQRTSGAGTTDVGVQGTVLLVRGHVPALRANAAVGGIGGTGLAIATLGSRIYIELGSTIHHGTPGIKATVLVAVESLVFVAPAGGIGSVTAVVIVLHASVCVVQVLGHPGLGTDGDSLVDFVVAKICKGICGSIIFAAVLDARFFAR